MSTSGTTNHVRVLLIDGGKSPFPVHEGGKKHFLERVRVTRKTILAEGLDALQNGSFAVVLLDFSLPGASTIESVKRTLQFAKDVPVIALVNESERTKGVEAVALGAEDYVVKGCQCGALVRAMEYAVERKELIAGAEGDRVRMAQDREQLTAHLSHELRNALACIHQFGNILIEGLAGAMTEEQREYLGIMLQNATRIRTVVDGLLEVAPDRADENKEKAAQPTISQMAN